MSSVLAFFARASILSTRETSPFTDSSFPLTPIANGGHHTQSNPRASLREAMSSSPD